MDIAGYIASVLIGISLGLTGGGGSILTVPVFVYLFNIDAASATVYSLFVVGITSTVGSVSYFKRGMVNAKTVVVFGVPSVTAVFLTRAYIAPAIPQSIFSIGNFTLSRSILLMLLFALLMVFASYSMIRKSKGLPESSSQKLFSYPLLFTQGIFIGIITGLVGAGGGFLITPVLVNLLKMPMKTAVGTSLVIIAINSLAGFLFSVRHTVIQWSLLVSVTAIAIAGILIGSYVSTKIDDKKLKPGFGWFILVMGICIILKETIFK